LAAGEWGAFGKGKCQKSPSLLRAQTLGEWDSKRPTDALNT
jgi:hypothetical protein